MKFQTYFSKINIYVGEDEKLHFIDKDGADTVLNFSKSEIIRIDRFQGGTGDGNNSHSSSALYFTNKRNVHVDEVTIDNPDHYNKELSFEIINNENSQSIYNTTVPVKDISIDIDASITSFRLLITG